MAITPINTPTTRGRIERFQGPGKSTRLDLLHPDTSLVRRPALVKPTPTGPRTTRSPRNALRSSKPLIVRR